jgi:microcin C transport system permease protein
VILGNAIPSFLFAILLIVVFAGGRASTGSRARPHDFASLSLGGKVSTTSGIRCRCVVVIGGFAGLTMLTKDSFLDQISQRYVVTARQGSFERRVLYEHVFRNAMLIVIAASRRRSSACCSPARC